MPSDPDPPRPSRVWIARAQPQAEATAARLRALGFAPVVAPVLTIHPTTDGAIDLTGVDALAFTSTAGVAAFAGRVAERGLRVFAVGDATARAARAEGFGAVDSAQGDVHALAERVAAARPRPGLVLNPTAADPAADLVALLAARGIAARSAAVYETREAAPLAAPETFDAVLIHSAKAARAVARVLAGRDLSQVGAYAISAAAAAPLAGLGFQRLAIAPFPNEASLLNLLQG